MTTTSDTLAAVRAEVAKAVIGQERVVNDLLVALLLRGHVILEGVPGVAKTLVAKTLAEALDLSFRRIQFTPDLMPSDVTGNVVLDPAGGELRYRRGPLFANLILVAPASAIWTRRCQSVSVLQSA
jgi:MoxR-like ATPase